ncbi:hypothetical protein GCM10008929_01390 [Alkalibacterium psychrotolerans]
MKQFLCPALSIGFYLLYFVLLQLIVLLLPDSLLTTIFIISSVFLLIPFIASKSSALVMRKIKGASCSI